MVVEFAKNGFEGFRWEVAKRADERGVLRGKAVELYYSIGERSARSFHGGFEKVFAVGWVREIADVDDGDGKEKTDKEIGPS